ncbi:acyl-CoA mutase large subunit family protein [Acidithrix ferrooxidans]|uniref:Methylmalonyl-CoA mutase n=3 Tax=root TaxID=1 RepID=A0A0D8HGW1_9ACTN|nr:acyl-CoA mutase large subunit family protein [Acidithrix ferrooxidans]KJF17158.1 methylmalonyl-CoA mutase [Acidithrix ferrooxidans]
MADEIRRTTSGIELKPIYGYGDIPEGHRELLSTSPGEPPYLRGAYPKMYRTKPWRIFQLSGFGNPIDESERIKFLLSHGESGFLMEHDRMTADHLYDVDNPEVLARSGDVGLTGAVILSIRDFATILDGIDIENTYAHAGGAVVQHGPFANACYWNVAASRGIDLKRLAGTGQSDFNLTYLGCIAKEQIPPRDGLRLNLDLIEFCHRNLPRWVPVSIAAYNGADSGLNAKEELGLLMANAKEYLDGIVERGNIEVAQVARSIGGINLRTSMDIFEDIAKLRAARVMWSRMLKERYGVDDERARQLRIHVVTAGSAMTYQQPLNNIVRGTLMALAAVLGGAQSLGVSGYDEAITIPSEHAHQMSLRIQQILQNESNLTSVVDPLGGSYLIESLTGQLVEEGFGVFDEIVAQGGYIATLESGWLYRRAVAGSNEAAYDIETNRVAKVGVNCFMDDVSPYEIEAFEAPRDAFDNAMERLVDLRATRDQKVLRDALVGLEEACVSSSNIMPAMMAATEAEVSLGEIGAVFRSSFGSWEVPFDF